MKLTQIDYTQRNFAADFRDKCTFKRKRSSCVFETNSGDLGATYAINLRLIGRRTVDFLLVIIDS